MAMCVEEIGHWILGFRRSKAVKKIFVVSFFKRRVEKYNSEKGDVAYLGFCDLRACWQWVGDVDVQQRDNGGQICDKKHGRFWSKLDRERLETIIESSIENIYSWRNDMSTTFSQHFYNKS